MHPPEDDGKRDAGRYRLPAHLLHFGFVLEYQCGGIEAVAQACRWRAVVKDMSEVTAATGAEDFGADHAQGNIVDLRNVFGCEGAIEAGPSRTGVELRAGSKERESASCAEVDAILVVIEEVAAEGGLGSLCPQDTVDGGAKLFLPLGIGLHYTGALDDRAWLPLGSNEADGNCAGII